MQKSTLFLLLLFFVFTDAAKAKPKKLQFTVSYTEHAAEFKFPELRLGYQISGTYDNSRDIPNIHFTLHFFEINNSERATYSLTFPLRYRSSTTSYIEMRRSTLTQASQINPDDILGSCRELLSSTYPFHILKYIYRPQVNIQRGGGSPSTVYFRTRVGFHNGCYNRSIKLHQFHDLIPSETNPITTPSNNCFILLNPAFLQLLSSIHYGFSANHSGDSTFQDHFDLSLFFLLLIQMADLHEEAPSFFQAYTSNSDVYDGSDFTTLNNPGEQDISMNSQSSGGTFSFESYENENKNKDESESTCADALCSTTPLAVGGVAILFALFITFLSLNTR